MFQTKGIKKFAAEFLGLKLPAYKPKNRDSLNPFILCSQARTALIVMPFDNREFELSLNALTGFQRKFPAVSITLVLPEQYRGWIGKIFVKKVIALKEEHANFLKLPKKELLKLIKSGKYDVALDFNPEGSLFSYILCAASGAEVRIGFAGEMSERFLNYSIVPRKIDDKAVKFDALVNYLY